MVAGGARAMAAVVIARRTGWTLLSLVPVYHIYRTYVLFIGRLEDSGGSCQMKRLEERVQLLGATRGARRGQTG